MARRINHALTPSQLTRLVPRSGRRGRRGQKGRLAVRPVAMAAMLLLGAAHGVADAGVPVSVALRSVRGLGGTINAAYRAPAPNALPVTLTPLNGADGKAQNIASAGTVTGALSTQTNAAGASISVLDLNHASAASVVKFNSFDIGSQAAVNAWFTNASGSALYQVSNSTAPSQIYGALNTYYRDGNGVARVGGELLLINQNGILFGKGAQVNVGGLIASALNVGQDDYLNGLGSISAAKATFFGWTDDKGISTYAPERNFVKVDTEANITTASGGRVFLLGGQVENAGRITTPNGQTVLAAGREVYLSNPAAGVTPLYMSEANDKVPTVKGLLVEVNGLMNAQEFATNSGSISTPTGNTTIVGWAVNQRGRISATTSVTQNGSVYLLARSGATASSTTISNVDVPLKSATQGGTLTVSKTNEDSGVFITPDVSKDANGALVKGDAGTPFTPSRIEMSGRIVDIQDGTRIVAPNASLNIRASMKPAYTVGDLQIGGNLEAGSTARILLGADAVVDVAGTTDTVESVARNFVTTELLGAQDLKDAPLQKDGPLYRSKLTFDIRGASPILGDISSYRNGVKKSASESMSAGGKVLLDSTGDVVAHQTSRIDVSGGKVTYTEATVNPSVLIGQNGKQYTLNNAPADIQYVAIAAQESKTTTRFGTEPTTTASPLGHKEAGYVDGQSAGQLTVLAPVALMDGHLKATTTVGARQQAGLDPLAGLGKLTMGTGANLKPTSTYQSQATANRNEMGSGDFVSAVMSDLKIGQSASALTDAFWADGDDGSTAWSHSLGTSKSRVSAQQLNASGFGTLAFAADKGISLDAGADLILPRAAMVDWRAAGSQGITLAASVRSEGGTFSAVTRDANASAVMHGALTLKQGSVIDMSGNFVNQYLDGNTVAGAVAGGSITLKSDHALNLEDGSGLNVSGGMTVGKSGGTTGTNAGSITLEGMNAGRVAAAQSADGTTPAPDQVHIGAALQGLSLAQGGSLSIKGWDAVISDRFDGLAKDSTALSLNIGSNLFNVNSGGFGSIAVDGAHSLIIDSDAQVKPKAVVLQGLANARLAATGSDVGRFVAVDTRAETLRKPVNLAFKSTSKDGTAGGVLTMREGATIQTDPLASVSLTAYNQLNLNGRITAKAGKVKVAIEQSKGETGLRSSLTIGGTAAIDVSGIAQYTGTGSGLQLGDLYDGGSIRIATSINNTDATSTSRIDIDNGATLNADGATGLRQATRQAGSMGPAYGFEVAASSGGSIDISSGGQDGGAYLGGKMSAKAGAPGKAQGGTLSVTLGEGVDGSVTKAQTIQIQDAAVTQADKKDREIAVSTAAIKDGGFANVYLKSSDQLRFKDKVNLSVDGHLRLDASVFSATDKAKIALHGGSTFQWGSSQSTGRYQPTVDLLGGVKGGSATLAASGGMIELFGQTTTQGLDHIAFTSNDELRLRGFLPAGSTIPTLVGALNTAADLDIDARQVSPTTMTDFTINAVGQSVTFGAGDKSATTPISGGGAITVNAADITQNGVLRAPLGTITLNATHSLTLGDGSLTSVSGDGLLVPYGETTGGGKAWTYGGKEVTSFKDKAITLNAPGQSVDVMDGATLDLSGGGNLIGYEFVPGPGGSKDIFAGALNGAFAIVPTVQGYTPYDAAILASGGSGASLSVDPNVGNALGLGNTLTFGNGGPIAAGTYAVLPARYALLPGAYLVKPNGGVSNVGLGYSQARADGSYVVGALAGTTGMVTAGNVKPGAYTVMSSEVARRYSEIKGTTADDFQAAKAAKAGTSVPMLSKDAGRLSVVASSLALDGQIQFNHLQGARGGQLDIASSHIHVGDVADKTEGVLNLSYEQLNRVGADSVLLGGVRGQSSGTGQVGVTVSAQDVVVDGATGQALSVGDLIIAAQDQVDVGDGAQIVAADATGAAQALSFQGDGALLRISKDANATSERSGVTGQSGQLIMGDNLTLKGGAITAEATLSTQMGQALQSSASGIQADRLVLGASRIEVGGHDAQGAGNPLVLTGALADQLNQTKDLTLRSFSSVDLFGNAEVGGTQTRTLTVDGASIRMKTAGAQGTLRGGEVNLVNTSGGLATPSSAGGAVLLVQATGANGGAGHVTLGQGTVALDGVQSASIKATGSVVLKGNGGLEVPGDMTMTAQSLTASRAADAKLGVAGAFALNKAPAVASTGGATAGEGASVAIHAASVSQNGSISLPSGKLTIQSDQTVNFRNGSVTDVSGLIKKIDGQGVTTMGGALMVTSAHGDIQLDKGGLINASAGLGDGSTAGSMAFSAVNGAVVFDGRILATSQAGQQGGSLSIDARDQLNLKALAQRIADESAAGVSNFSRAIALRNRSGSQTVEQGTTFSANSIQLSLDAGDLTVKGALLANGASGGTVALSASGDVVVADGADIQAKALSAGGKGGAVNINTVDGQIKLDGGSIDTSGLGAGDGTLSLRAPRTSAGVAITPVATALNGVSEIDVEAVRRYDVSSLSPEAIDGVYADLASYLGSQVETPQGAISEREASVIQSLSGLQGDLATKIKVRAGVELDAMDDLQLGADLFPQGWNVSTHEYALDGQLLQLAPGQTFNLTLRTAGNLYIGTNLGDGFSATGMAQKGPAGNITLVAGADMQSSSPTSTAITDQTGDILIGAVADASGFVSNVTDNVSVRNTTGKLNLAAARDIKLTSENATLYTTGAPVDAADVAGFVAVTGSNGRKLYRDPKQAPFLTGGGSISVQAGRDVAWLPDLASAPQFVTDWWYRYLNKTKTTTQYAWWSRYDLFKQGIATFGGGDISVSAGRDAWNVQALAATSGYMGADGWRQFGGGDVSVTAGRDVIGGAVMGSVNTSVEAGRHIATSGSDNDLQWVSTPKADLQVLYGSGLSRVMARNDLTLGRLTMPGLLAAAVEVKQANIPEQQYKYDNAGAAKAAIAATAGTLVYKALSPDSGLNVNGGSVQLDDALPVLPGSASFTSASGDVVIEKVLYQAPSQAAKLDVLATGSVSLQDVNQFAAGAGNDAGQIYGDSNSPAQFYQTREAESMSGHLGGPDRTPVRIVAEQGDVNYTSLDLVQGLRLIAGRDVAVSIENGGRIVIQHQTPDEVSLIQAGRDILAASGPTSAGIEMNGPGNLILAAGRDIDLKSSQGIVASGNLANAALPKGSADITVLAGVDFSKGDIRDAVNAYYPVLGSLGVGQNPGLLYTQIKQQQAEDAVRAQWAADGQSHTADQIKQAVDQAKARAEAAAKADLASSDLVALARAVAGDADFDNAVMTYMRQRESANMSADQAQAAFTRLSAKDQQEVASRALTKVWTTTVSQDTRLSTALNLAAATDGSRAQALRAFMAQREGTADEPALADALLRFGQLPVEQQLLFVKQQLAHDVTSAIVDAASKSNGAARDAAYLPAYQAISTVFPHVTAEAASINLGASQIKTVQGSTAMVFNLNGGVDVGALTADSAAGKSAAELGLVTAGGGDIGVIVRDNVAVNTSRIFTLVQGNEAIWSSLGNVDAGRGAKTVTATPSPVFYIDDKGRLQVDISSAISGSGIAATGLARIAAPKGEINAGDAGISATQGLDLAANVIRNSDAISSPSVNGTPPAPAVNLAVSVTTPVQPTAAGDTNADDKSEADRKKRRKRSVLLDFLGFGSGDESGR